VLGTTNEEEHEMNVLNASLRSPSLLAMAAVAGAVLALAAFGSTQVRPAHAEPPAPATPVPPPVAPLPAAAIALKPDLRVTSFTVAWGQSQLGLAITVANSGSAAAGAFTVAVTNQSGSAQTEHPLRGLGAGQSVSFWLPLPAFDAGVPCHGAVVTDRHDAVDERDERNNTTAYALSWEWCHY
jgi:hypothetical protein